ncbi:MAG: hypothetical protein WDM96_11015 [Lacunisphaera sp.]
MNSSLTILERFTSGLNVSPILARRGFTCTLLTLEPDTETALPASSSADDQLLFVIDGDIAVHTEGLTIIVQPRRRLPAPTRPVTGHLGPLGRGHALVARGDSATAARHPAAHHTARLIAHPVPA